jgi:transglutaminase-like putative cysteine protease
VPRTKKAAHAAGIAALLIALFAGVARERIVRASGAEAPSWMHALTSVPLPAYDEKTDAVVLYSESVLTVQGPGKLRRTTRNAFKILRPGGREYGTAVAFSRADAKILNMRGWCIPAQGRDYEVKDKDAQERNGGPGWELVTDLKVKILKIPESEPGSIVGYEIEQEEYPYVLQDRWMFQERVPVREARYTLQLPPGWEYKVAWANAPEVKPVSIAGNQWQWTVNDVKEIRHESEMPPWRGVAGHMFVTLFPPGGSDRNAESWSGVGKWYYALSKDRAETSPEIRQKVTELTQGKTDVLSKIQALSNYLQRDVRYVAIELGIGGFQPHAARDVYNSHYGDCKDKATLLRTMLKEIGVESYAVVVNVERGGVNAQSPPQPYFNHMILGIRLPESVQDPTLEALYKDASLGRILIFDPTDELTPLGKIRGPLQGNYGLLVLPDGGELILFPELHPQSSGIRRSGKFTLRANGTISGEVVDMRYGDAATRQRYVQREVTKKEDQIKPIETLLSHTMGTYQITKATIGNLDVRDQPFQYAYSFVVPSYAKTAGELMLVRVCLLGEKSSDVLEKKEPRKYPIEFEGPHRDADRFDITLPDGYVVDELPSPADAEYSFGSYHSNAQVKDNVLTYSRTFEIREVTVPLSKMDDLKKFYRLIASDERNTVVLKPVAH